MRVRGALVQIGPHGIDRANWDWDEVDDNPFFSPDAKAADVWAEYLDEVRKAGSSAGAIIEVVATGVPAGLGAPVYGKLDPTSPAALMSINAVKGVEIGAGFAAAADVGRGERRRDAQPARRRPAFLSPTMPAASWAASRPASRSWRASRSSRPARS